MYENAKATNLLQGVGPLSEHTLRCLAEVLDAGIRMTYGKWTFCPMMTVAYATRGGTGQCDVAGTKAKLDVYAAYEPKDLVSVLLREDNLLFSDDEVSAAMEDEDTEGDPLDDDGLVKHYLKDDGVDMFISIWDTVAAAGSENLGTDGLAKFGFGSEAVHIALREAVAAVLAGHTRYNRDVRFTTQGIDQSGTYEFTV